MRYIDTRSIFSVSNTLEKYHIKQHKSRHMLHDVGLLSILKSKKKQKLTKAQRKRIANEKRRKFIANIVMHHHELHQENRKKAIEKEKSRILSNIVRRPKVKSFIELQREERARKKEINNSLSLARDRVYARRVRSRSRWNELTENQVNT
jgi:Zn-dependent oligopeptidase